MSRADPRQRTDAFRYGVRTAWLIALLLAALLALAALVRPGFDPGSRDPLWLALACLFLAAALGAALWMARRPPVMLRVGPEGFDMAIAFRQALPWSGIHLIRAFPPGRALPERTRWLRVDLLAGVEPGQRLPEIPHLDRWFRRKAGIRIPLHLLDTDPEDIIASIERFRPVIRERG